MGGSNLISPSSFFEFFRKGLILFPLLHWMSWTNRETSNGSSTSSLPVQWIQEIMTLRDFLHWYSDRP